MSEYFRRIPKRTKTSKFWGKGAFSNRRYDIELDLSIWFQNTNDIIGRCWWRMLETKFSPSYSHHHIVVTNITDNYGNIVKRTAFCICCRSWPFWSDMQAVLLGLLLGLLFLGFLLQLIMQGCKILRQIIVNNEEQPSPGFPISVTTGIGAQSA